MTKATPHHAASEAPRRCIDHSSLAMRHCSILVAMSLCSVVVFPRPLVMPGGFLLGVAPLMCQPGLDTGGAPLPERPPRGARPVGPVVDISVAPRTRALGGLSPRDATAARGI